MILKNEQIDLCINCMNIHHCFYYKNKKRPVLFCEEYTFEDTAAPLKDFEQPKKAEAMFLPARKPSLFDGCGKLGQGHQPLFFDKHFVKKK